MGNETVPKIMLNFVLRMARSVKQHCAVPMYRFDTVSCRIWCVVGMCRMITSGYPVFMNTFP